MKNAGRPRRALSDVLTKPQFMEQYAKKNPVFGAGAEYRAFPYILYRRPEAAEESG